jgi:hypothetical protein
MNNQPMTQDPAIAPAENSESRRKSVGGESIFPDDVRWAWPRSAPDVVNLHVEILHAFEGPCAPAVVKVAADSRYALWLNGELVGTGPFTDWPETRSVDEWAVRLKSGRNALALLVCRFGVDHFSHVDAPPGVAYAVVADGRMLAASGAPEARWRVSPAYRSGPMPRITSQLPFTFEFDAGRDDAWKQGSVAAVGWTAFTVDDGVPWLDCGRTFRPRPLPAPPVLDRLPASVIAQGVFRRAEVADDAPLAERMQRDWLSSRTAAEMFGIPAPVALGGCGISPKPGATDGADGFYAVVDLGAECVGYFEIEVTAQAGDRIDFSFGEHLDDLRVRSHIGARNFASSFVCGDGRQAFTHLVTRFGARYFQLHVSGVGEGFILHYAGMRETLCPVAERGAFQSPDRLLNRLQSVSVRTLRLCMHDHYDDCPWREQGLYANDMLNQSLAGYYALGEYRFPQVSLDLLGGGLGGDGLLELCAPARFPITIPSFTVAWVLAVEENFLFSGDTAFARSIFPKVRTLLSKWLAWMKGDLLPSPAGERYWHFYDWTPGGMDGTLENDCTRFATLDVPRFDAPLNAFFVRALDAGVRLARGVGDETAAALWEQCAAKIRGAFHRAFWDASKNAYLTFRDEPRHAPTELTQSHALLAGCCPAAEAAALRRRLIAPDNGLVPASLSQSLHKFEAVLADRALAPAVMDRIAADWGRMLDRDATAFWETAKGGWDFDLAGSLCHGWSAVPAYIHGAYVLGIRPIEPGFKTFAVDPAVPPLPGTCGKIPTPAGIIEITWDGPEPVLNHPASISPRR